MGCTSSKLDDLPAVALCRERCNFLDEAIQQRYVLAQAHVAYLHSLKGVGFSLHRFFDQDVDNIAMSKAPLSPVLPLPKERKGDPKAAPAEALVSSPEMNNLPHPLHSTNSDSHLHFHSDSDDDEGSSGSLHHSGHSSPLHIQGHHDDYGMDQETLNSYPTSFPGGFMNMNYMKKQPTPSVSYEQRPAEQGTVQINYMNHQPTPSISYEQRPMGQESLYMGESSSYYPNSYPNPYPNSNPSPNPYYGYSNYGGMNGYFGGPPPYGGASPPPAAAVASSSKPPPPPPPPPTSSGWDFLNPFESYDKYYSSYTPSRDSKEVRDEEGIPDLEEEEYPEVVKEVHGDQKFVDGGGGGGRNFSKSVVGDEDGKVNDREALYQTRPSVSVENEGMEYEVHVVEKKVVDKEDKQEDHSNVAAFKARGGPRGVSEVVTEIQSQFDRAFESGTELAGMLEVGKLPYHRKHAAYQVSSKMLHVITPSLPVVHSQPSTFTNAESSSAGGSALLGLDEDTGNRMRNLSSTLHKLYLWEKKLYNEVKAEEKMRVVHERKCRRLKRLDEKGAEAHKINTTQALIRSLSTKIRISIQVVDKISVTINKIRDEELWPQLNELIQGLTRMWKSMLECHHNQSQAIKEARSLDAIASHKNPSDSNLEATMQLQHELINWTLKFSTWITAQKSYIKALNNWLLKCLYYEPEETPDGIVPFSPGRIGAPPIFVICNQWSQAMDRISEKEVVDAMRICTMSVLQFWERDKLLMRQTMAASKDLERKVKNLDREDHKIHKEIQALDKRMVMISGEGSGGVDSGQIVYPSDTSSSNSLQMSLQHTFEAMERFTASEMKAYEELLQRDEEDRVARQRAEVS